MHCIFRSCKANTSAIVWSHCQVIFRSTTKNVNWGFKKEFAKSFYRNLDSRMGTLLYKIKIEKMYSLDCHHCTYLMLLVPLTLWIEIPTYQNILASLKFSDERTSTFRFRSFRIFHEVSAIVNVVRWMVTVYDEKHSQHTLLENNFVYFLLLRNRWTLVKNGSTKKENQNDS